MKTINITADAEAAIRSAADRTSFKQTAVKRPDGTYDVPLADDTLERLDECRFDGESYSDCLVRMAAFWTNGRKQ